MKTITIAIGLISLTTELLSASEFYTRELPATEEITTAKISFLEINYKPRAILVLCPGMNSDPHRMLQSPRWMNFAKSNRIALAGIHFVSPKTVLFSRRGYTSPQRESGDILLRAIQHEYGGDIPLILYGFSSGALFVKQFVIWNKESVLTWAAHATGWYSDTGHLTPPGVISCGDRDALRLAPSLTHFKLTRSKNSLTIWIELRETGHEQSEKLNDFVCAYFQSLLERKQNGIWVDITNLKEIPAARAVAQPTLSGWLPDQTLISKWRNLW